MPFKLGWSLAILPTVLLLAGCHSSYSPPVLQSPIVGEVQMWDWPYDSSEGKFGPWTPAPVRGIAVFAIDSSTGSVFASTTTNEDGSFYLEASQFPSRWFVRAQAIVPGASLASEVLGETGARVGWTLRSEDFEGRVQEPVVMSTEPGSAINGALHIADTLYRVDRFLVDANVPASAQSRLRMWWSPIQSFPCGSCFVGSGVWLGGAPEDPDEYDDQIIMHEAYHFLSHEWYADSSPGGRHVGDPLIPTLAWGEGMATALALMTSNDPLYVDYRESYVRIFEVEDGADPRFWGTYAGGVAGDVSEYLVAAFLWDLFDGDDSHEAPYSVQLTPKEIVDVLRDWMPSVRRKSLGHSGLDFADFAAGLGCTYPERLSDFQKMLDHRRFPLNLSEVRCNMMGAYPATRDEPEPPVPLNEPDVKKLALLEESGRVVLRHPDQARHRFEVKVQRRGATTSTTESVWCEGTPCVVASEFVDDEVVIVTGAWDRQEPFGLSLSGRRAQERLYGPHERVSTSIGPVREYRSVVRGR